MLGMLTDKQNKAKNLCIDWYKNFKPKVSKPVFVIAGIAGSGKTFVISHIIEELGISDMNVVYCAYTGMACTVLIRRGLEASTIHRLIYKPVEIIDKETKKKKIIFELKENLDINISLIIVDEISMVSQDMMKDLESFGIPIIGLGDPFQLQPIYGNVTNYLLKPDFFLDEPIRQALENPIYYIANELRNYRKPEFGSYGDNVNVYRKDAFPIDILYDSDQIIACKNATVNNINKIYRHNFLGFDTILPQEHEKLICLVNNWDISAIENKIESYLVNGLIGTAENIKFQEKSKTFTLDFQPTFFKNSKFQHIYADTLMFSDPLCKDNSYIKDNYPYEYLMRSPIEENSHINKLTYGYTITCHKSQGSEFNNPTFFMEFLNKNTYFNQFYTGVTRAKEGINIIY